MRDGPRGHAALPQLSTYGPRLAAPFRPFLRFIKMSLSPAKRRVFAIGIFSATLLIGLLGVEWFVWARRQAIETSDRLDPGLIQRDESLGWRLAPGWRGMHRHHDFEASYSTNPYGFRGAIDPDANSDEPRYAVVGDSFVFGFGVNDDETFVELLNRAHEGEARFLNFGTPGYSTDQEYLLIRDRVLPFAPEAVFLFVYLGNDLCDNELPMPLQADLPKPRFEFDGDKFVLQNPASEDRREELRAQRPGLMEIVLGGRQSRSGLSAWLNRSAAWRVLAERFFPPGDVSRGFEQRFAPSLKLFSFLVGKIRTACESHDASLILVLLPGRSYVERPGSVAFQYQNYLRKKILENKEDLKTPIHDLAGWMLTEHERNPGHWFYPNDGHLTPEGHRLVADYLDQHLPSNATHVLSPRR